MLPKFGATTNPVKDIVNEISLVAESKFDFVEISIEPEIFFSNQLVIRRSGIKKILHKNGMFVVVHAPWNTEFGNSYKEIREGWIEFCKTIIDITKPIGMKKLNVHLYSSQNLQNKKLKDLIIKNCIYSLKKLVNYGQRKKIEIVLEIMPGRDQIYEIQNIKKILASVEGLGLNFDSGHCFVNGKMNYVKKFLSAFQGRITHVHLHDNHGKRDEHLPLGKGSIDFEYIAKIFRKINYSGTITFETFHGGVDKANAVKSQKQFLKLLQTT